MPRRNTAGFPGNLVAAIGKSFVFRVTSGVLKTAFSLNTFGAIWALLLGATDVVTTIVGGFALAYSSNAGDVTLQTSSCIQVFTNSNNDVVLPTAAAADGMIFFLKNDTGASNNTVTVTGGGTIEGASSRVILSPLDSLLVAAIDGEYKVLSSHNVDVPGANAIQVKKFTFNVADLADGSNADSDVTVMSLLAGYHIHGYKIKHSTIFATFTSFLLSLYFDGDAMTDTISEPFDVATAVAGDNLDTGPIWDARNQTSAIDIKLHSAANVDISTGTTGTVDVWIWVSAAV